VTNGAPYPTGPHGLPDDPEISDETALWRRVFPGWWITDENQGRVRPTSKAFQNYPDKPCLSILIGEMVTARGDEPSTALEGFDGYALAAITAGLARTHNQGVVHDPNDEDAAHGLVYGHKTDSIRSRLAKGSVWVIPPP